MSNAIRDRWSASGWPASPIAPQIDICRMGHWLACLFLLAVCLGATGCADVHAAPADNNGNQPDDAVRNFFKLVQADDYKSVEQLWFGDSTRIRRLDHPPRRDTRQ